MKTIVNIYQNSIGAITHYCIREWTINIYAVERFVLENKLEDNQKNVLSEPGVYILVNKDCTYIGQSQNILERWRQHLRNEEKDRFDCAYAITDVRGFSATDLNALEYLFHTMVPGRKMRMAGGIGILTKVIQKMNSRRSVENGIILMRVVICRPAGKRSAVSGIT